MNRTDAQPIQHRRARRQNNCRPHHNRDKGRAAFVVLGPVHIFGIFSPPNKSLDHKEPGKLNIGKAIDAELYHQLFTSLI